MIGVIAVQPEDADTWREKLAWHFAEFTKNPVLTAESLWSDIKASERQLWVVTDDEVKAVVLTRIAADDTKTCVVTHAAGYDRPSWQHLWTALEFWAKGIGCKRIEAVARPGWERILRQFEMKKTHVILERSL